MPSIEIVGDVSAYCFTTNEEPLEKFVRAPMETKSVGSGWHWGGAYLIDDILARSLLASQLQVELLTQDRVWDNTQNDKPIRRTKGGAFVQPATVPRIMGSVASFPSSHFAEKEVWRFDHIYGKNNCPSGNYPRRMAVKSVRKDSVERDVLVISDTEGGLRNWPAAREEIKKLNPRHVVLRTHYGVGREADWWPLQDDAIKENLTVVVSLDRFRQRPVRIARGLSWERIITDLCCELAASGPKDLLDAQHLIINFDSAGLLHVTRQGQEHVAELYCLPGEIDGRDRGGNQGMVKGQTAALVAAIALEWSKSQPNISHAFRAGLQAMADLFDQGLKPSDPSTTLIGEQEWNVLPRPQSFSSKPHGLDRFVNYHLGKIRPRLASYQLGKLWDLDSKKVAKGIILEGPVAALSRIPHCHFHNLICVDREEIESYRSIYGLITSYFQNPNQRPLCLAVFGKPGSGKSFGIMQIVRHVQDSFKLSRSEHSTPEDFAFNLSQMYNVEELAQAFHKIRDSVIRNKIPVVFWDEFDTDDCRWLAPFLAPMYDGVFKVGADEYKLGPAIFIFGGGIFHSMEMIQDALSEEEDLYSAARNATKPPARSPNLIEVGVHQVEASNQVKRAYRAKKLPDFVSRLRGHVNVQSVNIGNADCRIEESRSYLIRRALIIRHSIERFAPYLIDPKGRMRIDEGVLEALLTVSCYHHEARSIEAVIAMCTFDTDTFGKTCLPSEHLLNPHVNGAELLQISHKNTDRTLLLASLQTHLTQPRKPCDLLKQLSVKAQHLEELVSLVESRWAKRPFSCTVASALCDYTPYSDEAIYKGIFQCVHGSSNSILLWRDLPDGEKNQIRQFGRALVTAFKEYGYTWILDFRQECFRNLGNSMMVDTALKGSYKNKKSDDVVKVQGVVEGFLDVVSGEAAKKGSELDLRTLDFGLLYEKWMTAFPTSKMATNNLPDRVEQCLQRHILLLLRQQLPDGAEFVH